MACTEAALEVDGDQVGLPSGVREPSCAAAGSTRPWRRMAKVFSDRSAKREKCLDADCDVSDSDSDCEVSTVCHTITSRTDLTDASDEPGSPVSKQYSAGSGLPFLRTWSLRGDSEWQSDFIEEDWEDELSDAGADVPSSDEAGADEPASNGHHAHCAQQPESALPGATHAREDLAALLSHEALSLVPCADAPQFAAVCRAFGRRVGAGLWRARAEALPAAVLQEAQVSPRSLGGGPCFRAPAPCGRAGPSRPLLPRHVAALESRALRDPPERDLLDRQLCAAARAGAACLPLLLQGAGANARAGGALALSLASAGGHEGVVRVLLDYAANAEAKDRFGDRPLSSAVVNRHLGVVRALLAHGACPDAPDGHGDTPLVCAAVSGQVCIVRALLHGRADVEATDRDGDTPLVCAAINGQAAAVRALVEGGAGVEAEEDAGEDPPLLRAAAYGHACAVQALLDCGADADARSADGRDALEVAEEEGHADAAQVLRAAQFRGGEEVRSGGGEAE